MTDECGDRVRRSRAGLDAAVLASSCARVHSCASDGGKKAVHRGKILRTQELEVSRKATAQGVWGHFWDLAGLADDARC